MIISSSSFAQVLRGPKSSALGRWASSTSSVSDSQDVGVFARQFDSLPLP